MKLKSTLIFFLIAFGFESFALQITLDDPPGDYRVYSLRGRDLTNKTYAEAYKKFSFTIPDEYLIKNSDGSTNLVSSLQNWRRSTPVADGNPRTRNGIGYYPFKDSNGNNKYIALEHIYENRRSVVQVQKTNEEIDFPAPIESSTALTFGETIGSLPSASGQFDPNELSRRVGADEVDVDIDISQNNTSSELATSIRPQARPREFATPSTFSEDFPPKTARFSTRRSTAESYTNSRWRSMSYTQKAEYMDRKYGEMLRAHGLSGTYSPKVLVCKAYKESNFRPQIRTSASNSTASGISQITRSTAVDTFSRGRWFRSKVQGFTHIRNGRDFHDRMAGSMLAQMEFGMAILEQKRRDRGFGKSSQNINRILQGYYGSRSSSANRNYANKIMSCVNCVERSGYSNRCLEMAR